MKEFKNNIHLIYGEKGRDWLNDLPVLISSLAAEWNLNDLVPCLDLTYNYVLSGYRDGLPIILKVGVDLPSIQQEYEAIRAFDGHGSVELIEANLEQGAILIQRAIPGKTLVTLFPEEDTTALKIACELIDALHTVSIPLNHKFPLLSEWLSIIDQDWNLPRMQLQLARKLKNDLLNHSKKQGLLHGDVHYANILSHGNDWLMIDPKGVIGDPLYDMTGCLLREPFKQLMALSDIPELLRHRMKFVAQFSGNEVETVWAWTYVQTVMSICWSLEVGEDVELKCKFLEILELEKIK